MPSRSLVQLARAQFHRRAVRYSMVSVVAVAATQVVLITCSAVLGWRPVPSNVAAVALGSVPSYALNRAWVWGRRGPHHLTKEVLPFWVMGFVGLAMSTLFVHVAARWSDATAVVSAANLTAFGLLWVAKYLVLDSVLFGVSDDQEPALVG